MAITTLLTSCQSRPTFSTPTPPAGAIRGAETPYASEPVPAIKINDDPPRSALFNMNTLPYELPGMDAVEVVNITYAHHGDEPLTLDVYYSPGAPADARLPVVVFGLGYRMSEQPLRNAHFYTSWGKLVAAAGIIGVTYDTEQPDQDLETLIEFIRDHAEELRVDPNRIGFMSSSANGPTVMSYLMQEGRKDVRFSIYYYTLSLTPDRKFTEQFETNCEQRGCLVADLANVSYVDPDLPLLIVKAGQDFIPHINEGLDYFIEYAQGEGADVTVIEYPNGRHGFDTEQHTDESATIIAQTVKFMQEQFGID
jgi:dienelactone hydrolase